MEKENWINEVLDSTSDIKKVSPSPFLWHKIEQKISLESLRNKVTNIVSTQWMLSAAASLLLLVVLNFLTVRNHILNNQSSTDLAADTEILSEFIGI